MSATIQHDNGGFPKVLPGWFWELYAVCYDSLAVLKPYQQMLGDLLDALDIRPGMTVLDYGCGTGNLIRRIHIGTTRAEVIGVDSSHSMLKRAKQKLIGSCAAHFVIAESPSVAGLRPASFDRIVSSNVLYTLPDPSRVLGELRQLLKPDGCMIHSTPQTKFNPMAVFWKHCQLCRGLNDFLSILRVLPALLLVGLMNIWIVKQGRSGQKFWSQEELKLVFDESGLTVTSIKPTYAGQDWLVRCVATT